MDSTSDPPHAATVPLPVVNARLLIRGLAALAVLTGAGFSVFLSFYPLMLLAIGTFVHPSLVKLHFAFYLSAMFGAIVLVLAVLIGRFVFSRLFASFAWRIIAGLCLTALSVWVVTLLGPVYLVAVMVFAAFLAVSVRDAATRQEPLDG
jgi:hypothetical protein